LKIIFSEKCLEYSNWHIESPERVREAWQILQNEGYEFIRAKPASEDEILRVHSKEYVEKIKSGNFYDSDSPAYKNIYEYARLSAGGAILAGKEKVFSLMRPPGHHAGRNGKALGAHTLGFCYFNNIAIAVKSLDLPTLILDIDGHHGNGTQEIFYQDSSVTFISLHRSPHYPGTGLTSEANCLNFPLPYQVGDDLYLKTLDKALAQINAKRFVVGISAGFDAHEGDLASLGLSSECFREIGKKIRALEKPVFGVLEGGYSGKNIGRDLHELIQGLEEP
jgi:acetoin utilization deacetylase AcuC-like enzyme